MLLRIPVFQGEVPRQTAYNLPDNNAQIAINCRLWSGALEPWYALFPVDKPTRPGTLKTLYRWSADGGKDDLGQISAVAHGSPATVHAPGHGRTTGDRVFITGTGDNALDDQTWTVTVTDADHFTLNSSDTATDTTGGTWAYQNGYWFTWTDEVDVAQASISNDTLGRLYWTGGGVPQMSYSPDIITGGTDYPETSFDLGLPAPQNQPRLTLGAGGGCDAANQSSFACVYTFVTETGEEGPESPPAVIDNVCPGQAITIDQMDGAPNGNNRISKIRVYLTDTGTSSNASYQLAGEVLIANATAGMTYDGSGLGLNTLESSLWEAPPSDMFGLFAMPNGWMVGFSGKDVCPSVANQPHAYPVKYRLTVDYPIVGGGFFDNNIVVLTTANPYLVTGADPSSLTDQKYPDVEACVAKATIASIPGGVMYASPNGLIQIGQMGVRNLTVGLYSPDKWKALKPSAMRAWVRNNSYFLFYDNGTDAGCLIFDPTQDSLTRLTLPGTPTAGYRDPLNDDLYFIIGGTVYKFDAPEATGALSYTWKSKKFRYGRDAIFTCGRILAKANDGSTTYKVYVDGTQTATGTVTTDKAFRLPGIKRGREVEVELTGTDTIYDVLLAESLGELAAAP